MTPEYLILKACYFRVIIIGIDMGDARTLKSCFEAYAACYRMCACGGCGAGKELTLQCQRGGESLS